MKNKYFAPAVVFGYFFKTQKKVVYGYDNNSSHTQNILSVAGLPKEEQIHLSASYKIVCLRTHRLEQPLRDLIMVSINKPGITKVNKAKVYLFDNMRIFPKKNTIKQ